MANKKFHCASVSPVMKMKEKKKMIRVIKTPENEIMLDATGRKKRPWSIHLCRSWVSSPGKKKQGT